MAKSTALAKQEWEWSEEKEKCFQAILAGVPQRQIASDLGVHYNTITNWKKHPAFAKRLQEELDELASSSKMRRIRTTRIFQDTVTNLATKALKEVQKKPKSIGAMSRARGWLAEFRAMRNEERLDHGDATEHVNHVGAFFHSGSGGGGGLSNTAFKELLKKGIADGSINPKMIKAATPREAIIEAVQQTLIDGELVRAIDKETGNQNVATTQEVQDAEYVEVQEKA